MKKIFLLILAIGFLLGCTTQGPVIIKSAPRSQELPGSEESSSTIPSPRYAPLPYSKDFTLRVFNPHPYPAKVIIGKEEIYVKSTQKVDIYFEKGIESRNVVLYAVFLDPESSHRLESMKSIGVYEDEIKIPARDDNEVEAPLVLSRIKKFRYLKKRRR